MLNKHDLYKKETIKLRKRRDELYNEILNQPFIEVTPFQRGWESSIVLRDDISNRRDADFIRHLINIGYEKFSIVNKLEHVKLIKQGVYQYSYKNRGEIIRVSLIPNKIKFSEKQYEQLSDREKRFFYKENNYSPYSRSFITKYYLAIPEYWIKLKVTPRMFDKIMDKNGELESEFEKISRKLFNPPYIKYAYRHRGRDRNSAVKNRTDRMILKEQLETINHYE